MEKLSLEFALLVFDLALVQCFLTMPPFLPSGTVMTSLCRCALEECHLLFDFDLTGLTVKSRLESQKTF